MSGTEQKANNIYIRFTDSMRKICNRVSVRIGAVSMKRMAVYAGILFAVSLIPLLWLGRYNVMCIDDYDYGRRVHDVWTATGSFRASVQAAWEQNLEFYRDWQGTYISCFLMALCPMNFYYEIGYVVPVLMIGMFASSVFVLGRHILRRWLGVENAGSCFVMFVLLFMFYQVPEAPFEGIYWYNGATHYVLMQSVWFYALTAVSMSLWSERKAAARGWCAAAAVLTVIVGGGNLVTGLQAEIVMALLVLYAVVKNRKKVMYALLPFVTGSVGFLFNILAPGNAQRSALDTDTGYSAVLSVLLSFYNAVVYIIRWTPAFVIVIWLLLLPVLWKLVKKSDRTFAHPVWVTIGAFCVLSAMFTPTLYALGMVGLSRVDNIIQMVWYLCLFMATAYWLGFFAHRKGVAGPGGQESQAAVRMSAGEAFGGFLEKTGGRLTAVCVLLVFVMLVCTADKNTYTSVSALRSIVNGEARTFYAEAMERHGIYTDDTILDVELAPYSAKPALFDGSDLSEDPGNWLNLAVTQYYHKNYVKIVKQ